MIKSDISNTNISRQLYTIVSREFDFISNLKPESYTIKYDTGRYGDYIYLKLKQERSIYIDLCITDSKVDLLIGKNTIPIYEMEKVVKEADVKIFEKLVSTLLTKPVKEIGYSSGNVDFINIETGEPLFTSRYIFSFLKSRSIKEKWEYEPWVIK